MRVRTLVIGAVAAALAVPALAQAAPTRYRVDTVLAANTSVSMSIGTVPQGEFSFALRVAADGEKRFRLRQRRDGAVGFDVIRLPGPQSEACHGTGRVLVCSGLTTPAPGTAFYNFKFTNLTRRPMVVSFTVAWRPVAIAG